MYRPYICPYDELLRLVPEGATVLDIGCGAGTFLLLLAEYCKPKTLGGIETNSSLVSLAQSSLDRYSHKISIRFEPYDGRRLPEWLGSYDHLFLIDVLHHIPKEAQRSFLEKIFDSLKPGTKFIIKDIDAGQRFWCLFNKLHDLIVSQELTHEVAATDLERILTHIGFKINTTAEKRLYVYPHFTITCTKV